MTDPIPLRLLAEEAEDLKIIAAAVQDAVVKAGNLKYEKRNRRFAVELNRYRWETAPTRKGQPGERVVVKGVFLLASEAAKESMGGGHSH